MAQPQLFNTLMPVLNGAVVGDVYHDLHPEFSARLKAMLAESRGRLRMTDGFRTRAQQADLYRRKPGLAAPPGRSLHERGRAADLEGDLDWAHKNAARFGLNFPMLSRQPGKKQEPWHVELAGADPSSAQTQTSRIAGRVALPGGNALVPSPESIQMNNAAPPLQDELIAEQGPAFRRLLSQFVQEQLQPKPLGALYDPNAPTPEPENTPWWTVDEGGSARWPSGYAMTGPSDRQQQVRFDLDKLAAEGKAAGLLAQKYRNFAKLAQARAEWDKTHPAPQMEGVQLPAAPQRQYAPLPERSQPRLDPFAGTLAAIAGFADPGASGMYGAAPLQAGVQQAQREYDDGLQRFKFLTQQFNQQLEDAERAHQLAVDQALNNQKVGFVNRQSEYQRQRAAYEDALQSQGLLDEADLQEARGQYEGQASLLDVLSKAKQREISDKMAREEMIRKAVQQQEEARRKGIELFKNVLTTPFNAKKPTAFLHGPGWVFNPATEEFKLAPYVPKPEDPLLNERREYMKARTDAVKGASKPLAPLKDPEFVVVDRDLKTATSAYNTRSNAITSAILRGQYKPDMETLMKAEHAKAADPLLKNLGKNIAALQKRRDAILKRLGVGTMPAAAGASPGATVVAPGAPVVGPRSAPAAPANDNMFDSFYGALGGP